MVSIVIPARNDNYGGDFLSRLQLFIDLNLPRLAEYAPDSELVITEWNPPRDRPRLAQALKWPRRENSIRVRIVEVPARLHRRLPNSEKQPLFEFIAKNVGIRRALGDYILVTNADNVFSDDLIEALGAMSFSAGRFYRADRYDYSGPLFGGGRGFLSLLEAKLRIHTVHVAQMDYSQEIHQPVSRWRRCRALSTDLWPGSGDIFVDARREGNLLVTDGDAGIYWGLHTNASGDFLLTHRNNWRRIRGFAEYTDTFTHLDSYACYQFKAAGVRQAIFLAPCMILHQDHSRETDVRPAPGPEKWNRDLEAIRLGRLGPAINDSDWGLAQEDLKDHEVCGD